MSVVAQYLLFKDPSAIKACPQEQQDADSSDEGEEEPEACSPSIDPILAVDMEADPDSPVADSLLTQSQSQSAWGGSDWQLAVKLQAREQEQSFASHLSDMHVSILLHTFLALDLCSPHRLVCVL